MGHGAANDANMSTAAMSIHDLASRHWNPKRRVAPLRLALQAQQVLLLHALLC